MATLAAHQSIDAAPAHWTQGNPDEDTLAHIPGEKGWPLVGHTFNQLADPHAFARRMYETYGPVYKVHTTGGWHVALIGAEANEIGRASCRERASIAVVAVALRKIET